MKTFKKISYLAFLFCVLQWPIWKVESASTAASSKTLSTDDKGQEVTSNVLGSIYRKSRQSRCVTCYEDRRYGSDDRSRYASYSSRSGDDRSSSWYYPSYDRYEDRSYRGASAGGGGEYDRYAAPGADRYGADRYGADRYGADRYGSDRYGSGADKYGSDRYGSDRYGASDRYGGYRDDRYGARPAYDRYDTRTRGAYERPGAYDRGESRGYGYDNRASGERDRYYERPRYGASAAGASAYGYDRDYNDRYLPSPAYGALLDRGSNLIAVEPVKANESANDSMTNNGDQQLSSGVENGNKQSDNGQNA